MKHVPASRRMAIAALMVAPGAAGAHGVAAGSIFEGLSHPVGGADHMLAMVAVGLISARLGGRSLYALPALFLGAMLVGFVPALSFPGLSSPAEWGIVISVFVLSALLVLPEEINRWSAAVATAPFGLCHGYAHGIELPGASSPWLYSAGFVAASAGLHLIGVFIGQICQHQRRPVLGFGVTGTFIGLAGLVFVGFGRL